MSFRLRLFLAMLLLVAAVTGAALWIAERSMSAAFAKALDARFAERLVRVARVRDLRTEEARALAVAIAQSVRLQAGLIIYAVETTEEPAIDAYENAVIALDQARPGAGWTLRLMDARGQPLPGETKAASTGAALAWKPDPARVAALLASGRDAQGLLPATVGAGWWETYLAPIPNLESNELLGGLLVARFTTEAGDETADDMRPGLLLDGRAVTGGWPPEIVATFSTMARSPAGRLEVSIDGVRHAVFWRQLDPTSAGIFPTATEICAFSLTEREQQQRNLRSKVLIAGLAALCVAALAALFLAAGLARPVRELVTATQAIGRGDFSIRATPRGGELGALAEAFNAMTADLALKDKYRNMLDLVSDPHIAEDLIHGGLELGGEEVEASVVFCDIRGFTRLSEGMAPKAVIEMLNEHFTPLTRVVYANGGVVLHFVGDLIIALFGAPRRSETAEQSAAACALGLIAERARLNAAGGRQIEVGIGVATGRMVAGRMGSKDRLNYSVFGARMNLAARLCSQAGPMQVVIDAPTLSGCGSAARAEPLGALKLKGFSEEIEAFQLLALDSPPPSD